MYHRFRHRYVPLSLIILLILPISGCVYLRLLEFKNQFSEFDRFFRVESNDHFTLHMRQPVIFREDFIYLAKLHPTRLSTQPQGKQATYVLKQLDAEDQVMPDGAEIIYDLSFNQDDQLTSWRFSPIFLAIAPPEFLELSLRALGSANVIRSKRQVKADLSKVPKLQAPLPQQKTVLAALGEPLEIQKREAIDRYVYRFKLDAKATQEKYDDRKLTVVKLDFDTHSHELLKMSGRFAGMKLSIDYRKLVR